MATEKRLVDANEVEDLFYKQVEYGATDLMDAFDDALNDAQTVDAVEVVHGRWVWTETGEEDYEQYWVCSKCGEHTYFTTNYCPDCGAKMDLEE